MSAASTKTGIYYSWPEDGELIKSLAEAEKQKHSAFEVKYPIDSFWEAEDYHQDYLVNNPAATATWGRGLLTRPGDRQKAGAPDGGIPPHQPCGRQESHGRRH